MWRLSSFRKEGGRFGSIVTRNRARGRERRRSFKLAGMGEFRLDATLI